MKEEIRFIDFHFFFRSFSKFSFCWDKCAYCWSYVSKKQWYWRSNASINIGDSWYFNTRRAKLSVRDVFLVDQETALKLVPLQTFRGVRKMENDAGSKRFLVHSYCCNSNFPESRKKQKKAQCLWDKYLPLNTIFQCRVIQGGECTVDMDRRI